MQRTPSTPTRIAGTPTKTASTPAKTASMPNIDIRGFVARQLLSERTSGVPPVIFVLVGVFAVLTDIFGVFWIGMVYLLHEMEHSELGVLYLVFS